jgi:hypothetical protein
MGALDMCEGCGARWIRKSGTCVEVAPGTWRQDPDFFVLFHVRDCPVEARDRKARANLDAATPCAQCGAPGIVHSAWGRLCRDCTDAASNKFPHGYPKDAANASPK